MKKFLLILLSLTLCACQAQTKSTTSTSKKACDVTSEEKTCNTKDPVFDGQKRNKVVQSPSIKALSHFFALLRIIVFFSYLLFDV